jgi:transposase
MAVVYTDAMYTCPHCQQTRYQTKDGLTGAGSQRVRCRSCGKRYTAQPKPHGYPPELRVQALKLYVDGMNFRRIARQLDLHHQTVINWVNAAADQVPNPPPTPEQVDTVELDELYTFVGHKKTASTS